MIDVFLVDDEYYERLSLKQNIPWAKHGMQVVGEASNGKTAFEKICELRPQIAIVDINMPSFNGLTLISKLNEENIVCKYTILTGYDEFKYAQEAVRLGVSDYVLKPINYDDLINILLKQKNSITNNTDLSSKIDALQSENEILHLEHYYNDLLNCNFNWQNIYQQDGELTSTPPHPDFATFQIAVMDISTYLPRTELRNLQKLICSDNEQTNYTCCLDNKNRFFFVFDATDSSTTVKQMESIMELVQTQHHSLVGIGKIYAKFEEAYLSYSEACIALQNASILKKDLVLYEELSNSFVATRLSDSTRNQLRAYIFNYNIPATKEMLNDIYSKFIADKSPWNCVILSNLELVNLLTEALSTQAKVAISFLEIDEHILDTLTRMKTIAEMQDWLINTFVTAIGNVERLQSSHSNVTISVENYIHEHFQNPALTITTIAKNLYLNYRYICHCFKRDKNITINDYLNKVRIDNAISLFREDVDNVSYVAEKCGFSSASYFSKQFKRYTGLSPKDFIKTSSSL